MASFDFKKADLAVHKPKFEQFSKLIYLIYRRVRPAFGLSFGFVLMYMAIMQVFSFSILIAAVGLLLVYLFADFYNDYWDYEEDLRNKRKDKLTINQIISPKGMKIASFVLMLLGFTALYFVNYIIFLLGVSQSILAWAYSHPKIKLKKFNISGYAVIGLPFFFFPLTFNLILNKELISNISLILGLFFLVQYVYILCQKDSTDLKDKNNAFTKNWETASITTAFFALVSSISLFLLALNSVVLLMVWLFNAFLKIFNIQRIFKKSVNRNVRGKIVLLEFLTPYIYVTMVVLLA